MAFDWSKVDGYREDMTAEEKLELLKEYEPPAPTPAEDDLKPDPLPTKGMVSKAQFDKVSSELASVKKQLRGKMSEEEQRELDRQAERENMENELKALRREKELAAHKASYLGLGYDEEMAEEAATALVDGENDIVFSIMKRHSVNAEKALRAKLLKETPTPPAGDDLNDEKKKQEEAKKLRGYFGLPT